MAIRDFYVDGINNGWQVTNASRLDNDITVSADVAIIGTGAGGGVAAEILAQAGLKVVMLEHGALKSSNDFNMQESDSYASLYQESAARVNKSGSITVLQGRNVGGGTTVNWTASFRTPDETLRYWQGIFDIKDFSPEAMSPWFDQVEKRLNITPWEMPPNPNNHVLQDGCEKLGYDWKVIPRNVKGCWNLGYCGMGCPTNAKQGTLVTTIPHALKNNASLVFLCKAERFIVDKDNVSSLECHAMMPNATHPTGRKVHVKAKHYVLAGGAINSPALLMRSDAPDPHNLLGKRTFIHPTVVSMAQFERDINGYSGAPQSIYSDQFQWKEGVNGPMGFKLEALPLHPGIIGMIYGSRGDALVNQMEGFAKTNCLLALLRDGFHEDSPTGRIVLRKDNSGQLDYEMSSYAWDGVKRALLVSAEIQFASGAKAVMPVHQDSGYVTSMSAARELINNLSMKPFLARIGTAHLMGGNPMSEDVRKGVVNSLGEHHQVENLSVMDGSVFPTSIGANPQVSIYALASKFASHLAKRLAQ